MRVPPVRGHVRFWSRELFGPDDTNRIWGSTSGDEGRGSRVALRLLSGLLFDNRPADLLPHDLRKSGKRPSFRDGEKYLFQLQRLPGCGTEDWDRAQRAVKLWLLLGCLGLHANRAAGSVWPLDPWAPKDEVELRQLLMDLGYDHAVQLADASLGSNAHELREAASNTVKGSPRYFGDIQPRRQPSPLKMKIIRLGATYRLLLTGLSATDMRAARNTLGTAKPLGRVAWHSL